MQCNAMQRSAVQCNFYNTMQLHCIALSMSVSVASRSSVKKNGRIGLVFGMEASIGQFYTAL